MTTQAPIHWQQFLTWQKLLPIAYALVTIILGFIVAKIVSKGLANLVKNHASRQQCMLVRKISFYVLFIVFFIAAIQQMGFKITALLSAAGVLTVAISFASQTAFSNIISGIFLIIEKPFAVGDSVMVNTISGEVISIDLLSIKLRTFDNTLVRIANEQLLKTAITNFSHFDTRRFDLMLGVAYDSDLAVVFQLLKQIAANEALALNTPEAVTQIRGFAESSIDLQFSVWSMRSDFAALKVNIQLAVQQCFADNNIELPFPQRSIHIISEST